MALYHCENCNITKTVADKYIGRKVRCPKCKQESVVGEDASIEKLSVKVELSAAAEEAGAAVFQCDDCGYTESAGIDSVGETRQCVRCGGNGEVEELQVEQARVSEDDVDLSDLADALGTDVAADLDDGEMPRIPTVTTGAPMVLTADAERRSFFQGNPLSNLVSGISSGLVSFCFCIVLAVLIYPQGWELGLYDFVLNALLVSVVIGGLFTALRSRIFFAAMALDPTSAVALSVVVAGIVAAMPDADPTVVATTALAGSMLVAIGMALVSWTTVGLGCGHWVRFLSAQILCGVPAALGFSVIAGGLMFVNGERLSLDMVTAAIADPAGILVSGLYWSWLPACLLGLVLFVCMRKYRNPLILVLVLVLACGLPYWVGLAGIELPTQLAPDSNRLQYAFSPMRVLNLYSGDFFSAIDWSVLYQMRIELVALAVLMLTLSMYKITRVENVVGHELDLGRELRVMGDNNLLAGLAGGTPLAFCLGRSMGRRIGGAAGPLSTVASTLVLAAAMVFSGPVFPFIPNYVVGGLLVFFGLNLVMRWLISARAEFFRTDDYMLLVLTFLATLAGGFVIGVGTGLALAMIVSVTRYGSGGVIKQTLSGANHRSHVDRAPSQLAHLRKHGDGIFVVRLQGFVTVGSLYGVLKLVRQRMTDVDREPVNTLIFDFSSVRRFGSAMNQGFDRLHAIGLEQDINMVLTYVPFEIEERLQSAGFVDHERQGGFKIFQNLDYAMEWSEDRLLEASDLLSLGEAILPELLEPVYPEPEHIPYLMKLMQPIKVKSGHDVFHQGDPSDAMYFVQSGRFRVELVMEGGKTLRLKKMGPGAVFGEMGLYTDAPRSATVTCVEKGVVYRLSKKRIRLITTKLPKLKSSIDHYLVTLLASRVVDANAMVRDLMR